MQIKNLFGEKVFWRAFKSDDTLYAVGLAEGTINPGQTGTWRDDSFPNIKIEIKKGDGIFGTILTRAGQQFSNQDNLIVDSGGNLKVDKPTFSGLKPGKPIIKKDVKFYNLINSDTSISEAVTFSLEQALRVSTGSQQSDDHSQTWSVEGKLAGNIGSTPAEDKGGLGGGGSAEVSVGFVDTVSHSLQQTYGKEFSTVWGKSTTRSYEFAPRFLHVAEIEWCLDVEEGVVSYGGEQTTYSIVRNASEGQITFSQFSSLDELAAKRPDLRQKFQG